MPASAAAARREEKLRDELALAQAKIRNLEHQVRDLDSRLAALEHGGTAQTQPKPVDLITPFLSPTEPETSDQARRRWGPEQATGAPDTMQAGDIATAWAPASPDGGQEWLQLSFARETGIAQVRVRETFNPGAISKISAVLADGSEFVLWEGTEPASQAPVEMEFTPSAGVTAGTVRVYLDTSRARGWNEIDAVELVGTDGSRQWAASASASSSYAERGKTILGGFEVLTSP